MRSAAYPRGAAPRRKIASRRRLLASPAAGWYTRSGRRKPAMLSEAATPALPLRLWRRKPRLEHFVMGAAVLALVVLVVLPLLSLLLGSVRGEEGLGLDHF